MNTKSVCILAALVSMSSGAMAEDQRYDIQDYRLVITPDFATKRLSLIATLTIKNPNLQSTFSFGLNDRYDSVKVISDSSPLDLAQTAGEITITTKTLAPEITLAFTLDGMPGKSNDEACEVMTDSSLFLLWSDRFYPIDFDDWATVQTTIVLPAHFQVIAPGRLATVRNLGSSREHVFETTNPAVCFSVFADARWIKTEKLVNGIPMQTLLHPGSNKFAGQIFTTSSEILKFYSETYCAYPFDQFSFVTLDGMYARRAFPGFVAYTPAYLEKEFTTTGHDAHETALLWWCYTLRGSGPGSFQWTEGFGDHAELLYDEKFQKSMPEFISTLEEGCGQSMQWWREEWLERKGVPVIALKFEVRENGHQYRVTGVLEQLESLYHLPVEIGMETQNALRVERVTIADRQTAFVFESKEKPVRIVLDPHGWLLIKKVYSSPSDR